MQPQLTLAGLQITLVGKLRSREDQATQLLLGLDDGTGTGMCSMWSEEDSGLVRSMPCLTSAAAAQLAPSKHGCLYRSPISR